MLVHGFTQTRRSWHGIAEQLAERFEVVTVDAPGHGDSRHEHANLRHGAGLVGAVGGRGTYVGYSMGGRLCLQLALDRPDLVARLVLISASPGIDDVGERAARQRADELLAQQLQGDGLQAFLDHWLSLPLFARLDESAAGRSDRLRNDPTRLAASLRCAGTGVQRSLWSSLGDIACPVLFVAGADDPSYCEIGRRLVASTDDASFVAIGGAGHSVHLERPAQTIARIRSWLDSHPPRASPAVAAIP